MATKKKPTAKQLAARKLFAQRAKAGTLRKTARKPAAKKQTVTVVMENPRPRIGTAKPRRKSERTGKAPSKRLVKRRMANTRKGYFPNPVARAEGITMFGVILNAPNDSNGNPRRLLIVYQTTANGVRYEGIYQLRYVSVEQVLTEQGLSLHMPIVGGYAITAGYYADTKRFAKDAKIWHD